MDIRQDSTPSIPSLLRALTGNCPAIAYEALLDLKGDFKAQKADPPYHPRNHAQDIVTELRMSARNDDADHLVSLFQSLPSTPACDSTLLVILLCTRHIRFKRHLIPSTFFATHLVSTPPQSFPSDIPNCVFDFPSIEDSKPSSPLVREKALHKRADHPLDFLAESATFHIDHATWFDNHLHQHPNHCINPPNNFQITNRLLDFIRTDTAPSLRARFLATPPPPLPVPTGTARDSQLLDFVLRRCISGPETDIAVDQFSSPPVLPPLARLLLTSHETHTTTHTLAHNRTRRVLLRRAAQTLLLRRDGPVDPLAQLIGAAEACGAVYRDILSFADAYLAMTGPQRTLRALAGHAADVCAVFHARLRRAANDDSVALRNRAWHVLHEAEAGIPDMCVLADVLALVDSSDGSSVSLLNLALAVNVRNPGNSAILALLYRLLTPYMAHVWDWVFEASCRRDIEGQFFGSRLGLASISQSENMAAAEDPRPYNEPGLCALYPDIFNKQQALFLLRAGRTRELLSFFGLQNGVLGIRPRDLQLDAPDVTSAKIEAELSALVDKIVRDSEVNSGAEYKDEGTPVIVDSVTTIVSTDQCQSEQRYPDPLPRFRPLTIMDLQNGTHAFDASDVPRPVFWSIEDLEEMSDEDGQKEPFTLLLNNYEEQCIRLESSTLPGFVDGERLPHGTLFAEFILKPLRRIDKVVQEKVMQQFVDEIQLFEHLRNLRAHALLGAGDFASVLVEQIDIVNRTSEANEKYIHRRANAAMTFYGTSGAGEKNLRDRMHLNRCLRTALNLYSAHGHQFAELLQLDSVISQEDEFSSSEKLGLWDTRMELKYDAKFPLTIVLSDEAIGMYSKLFDLFVRVLRARKSLARLFMVSRRRRVLNRLKGTRGLADLKLQGTLWQFCWHAEHFVSIFGGFEMEQVLGGCWDRFESGWAGVKNIWELRDRHNMFLEESIKRCLLNEKHKNVLKVMSGGFDIVVAVDQGVEKLITRTSQGPHSETKDVIDLLSSSTASLKRRCAFLTDVLERLLESGTLPHLRYLLNRLNFNHYYVKDRR